MAFGSAASGTATPVINTPLLLTTQGPQGTYVLLIDLTNMQAGDVLALQIEAFLNLPVNPTYSAYYSMFSGAPTAGNAIAISIPLPCVIPMALKFEITQTAGTARSYDWQVVMY